MRGIGSDPLRWDKVFEGGNTQHQLLIASPVPYARHYIIISTSPLSARVHDRALTHSIAAICMHPRPHFLPHLLAKVIDQLAG